MKTYDFTMGYHQTECGTMYGHVEANSLEEAQHKVKLSADEALFVADDYKENSIDCVFNGDTLTFID